MKKRYKIDDTEYTFICSVHDDIASVAKSIIAMAEKLIELERIAKDMGVHMEDGLYEKKGDIGDLERKIAWRDKRIKKLKEQIEKLRGNHEKK